MSDTNKAAEAFREAAEICERVANRRSEPRVPVAFPITPQSGAVQTSQLRKRTLQRLDDAVSSVRAFATVAEPAAAVKLLRVLDELRTLRTTFEVESRGRKLKPGG
jgi:hypothetical protein